MLYLRADVHKQVGFIPAVFLAQITVWEKERGVEKEGRIWVQATLEEISQEVGLSRRSIQNAKDRLLDSGYLIVKMKQHSYDRTLSYSLTDKGISNATV